MTAPAGGRGTGPRAAVGLGLALLAGPAAAEDVFPYFAPASVPSFVGVGLGYYPDYVGASDLDFGAAPFGRLSRGNRYIDFQVSFATANLLEHPQWRAGPTLQWRFGRGDVDSDAVSALPDITGSLELGAFAAYEIVGDDPRDRWRFGGHVAGDVTGGHEGFVASASVRRWLPLGRFSLVGVSLGTNYGSGNYLDTYFSVTPEGSLLSGLPVFEAGGGLRDIRTTLVVIQPLSETWLVGAGLLYARLLGDVADSPIVADAGSPDQVVFGVGIARAF